MTGEEQESARQELALLGILLRRAEREVGVALQATIKLHELSELGYRTDATDVALRAGVYSEWRKAIEADKKGRADGLAPLSAVLSDVRSGDQVG